MRALSYLTSLRWSTRAQRKPVGPGQATAARPFPGQPYNLTRAGVASLPHAISGILLGAPAAGRARSIPELLGEDALVQAVTGVEHHEEVDPARLFHLHPRHGSRFGVVGHCAH